MKVKPLVYLAAPYTSPSPSHNVHAATVAALALWHTGLVAVLVPHWSHVADLIEPMGYDQWMAFDQDQILHCDALLRLGGDSPGADAEVAFAIEHRIPTFTSRDVLLAWAVGR